MFCRCRPRSDFRCSQQNSRSGEQAELSYAELGQRFGISEANVKVTVHRLRRRYRELLREEVANTVETPQEIDEEIRHLFAAFS